MFNNEKVEVLVFYHYFYPDDVVSARHFQDLTIGLAQRGFNVEAMPSNRSCRNRVTYPKDGELSGVKIRRIYRPNLDQSSSIGRAVNLVWMIVAWTFVSAFRKPNVLIVGTDPILSVLIAIPWKLFRPKTKVIHWCFDLYPDAAVAAGLIKGEGLIDKTVRGLCEFAYKRCDSIVDIGSCMRDRLPVQAVRDETIVPWALTEPELPLEIDQCERKEIFGNARVAILYSGNFGEAHSYRNTLKLAHLWRNDDVMFAFSIRGNKAEELRAAAGERYPNVRFVPFAEESKLENRLACADFHLVTLAQGWEGVVVPSKFFGALAIGRPILFDGPDSSAIARWIKKYRVGFLVKELTELPSVDKIPTREHCHAIYREHFSKQNQLDAWQSVINQNLA